MTKILIHILLLPPGKHFRHKKSHIRKHWLNHQNNPCQPAPLLGSIPRQCRWYIL